MSTMTTPAKLARDELAGFEGRLIGPEDSTTSRHARSTTR